MNYNDLNCHSFCGEQQVRICALFMHSDVLQYFSLCFINVAVLPYLLFHLHEDFHLERGNTHSCCHGASMNLTSIAGGVSQEATCTHFIQERFYLAWRIVVFSAWMGFWLNATLWLILDDRIVPSCNRPLETSRVVLIQYWYLDIAPISAKKRISAYIGLYLKSPIQNSDEKWSILLQCFCPIQTADCGSHSNAAVVTPYYCCWPLFSNNLILMQLFYAPQNK